MSKGSKIVLLRIPEELLVKITSAIISANFHNKGEPYTLSSWLRKCATEKIEHLERSTPRKAIPLNGKDST